MGKKNRETSAKRPIISTPPTNSLAVNCQPISSARMMPSSMTRLVEAIMKTIAAVKLAPFWNSDLAIAVAAYEQDDETMPKKVALPRVRTPGLPRTRSIWPRETNACTTPERPNPRMRAQSVSQNMKNASSRLPPMAPNTLMVVLFVPYPPRVSYQLRRSRGAALTARSRPAIPRFAEEDCADPPGDATTR
ncbi:MAG: hypothetical protein JF886_02545 [Candidatus Dormibacteraeota bacterium]|uniref:Uncharacterized protein n=1 Tax=Candidatus Aeolococcus gillhamiae TaxID=3127015 RepID=A0A934N4Y9_9BACT|nr:hypothetical protein [Candidatus Dormibacteraeota bacterium]